MSFRGHCVLGAHFKRLCQIGTALSLSLSFSLLLPLPLLTKNRQIEVYIQRRTFVSAPKWAWRRKMPFKTGKKLQWRERETSSLTELIRSGQLFGNYFTSQQ